VNSGKTLFAQLMDFLPWSTFTTDCLAVWRGLTGADVVLRRAGIEPWRLPS